MSVTDLPYSQESRAVFPLWEELAEATKEQEDVVIARIDASANDINMSMQGAYPSFCLFPALYAERVWSIFNVLCDNFNVSWFFMQEILYKLVFS